MSHKYKVGDHVSWNSEAGRVSGHITRVHTADTEFMGRTRHASRMPRNTRSRATRPIMWRCIKSRHSGS